MLIELENLSTNQVYYTFIQTIIPRPVAWVLTDNGTDVPDRYNLAPFSYFAGVSSSPPLLSLSIAQKPSGGLKDTALNISERENFVIHIPHRDLAQKVTSSAESLDHGQSELNVLDLELTQDPGMPLPRIKEARIAFYCTKYQTIQIGDTPQSLILGLVEKIYIDDTVGNQDAKGRLSVDPTLVDPLSRLGGNDYGLFGEVKTVIRPK